MLRRNMAEAIRQAERAGGSTIQASRQVMAALARPWFDRAALWSLTRWYFPLSRAWAAASVADGSIERFREALPADRLPLTARLGLGPALHRTAELKAQAEAAEAGWRRTFFDAEEADPRALFLSERRRRRASHAYMMARSSFALVRLGAAFPPVRWDIPGVPWAMERAQSLLADPARAYALPDPPPRIVRSRPLAGEDHTDSWLRFPSPSKAMNDEAWARVREPLGVADPPTLIYLHGLGVEFESLDGVADEMDAVVAMGVRLVRLEAPWHNRRRRAGFYGGEPFLSGQPLAGVELFLAVVRELGLLIEWARTQGTAPVAVGGTSMGALASQLVATRASDWRPTARPDAVILVTTSDDLGGLAYHSSLARATGLPQALEKAGWTPELLASFRPLVDPVGQPAIDPADIVMVLGMRDDVTPYARGAAMAERWGVPADNLFRRDQGHFSVPVGLMSDPEPLTRLVARLRK
jgi:hypothetical protein